MRSLCAHEVHVGILPSVEVYGRSGAICAVGVEMIDQQTDTISLHGQGLRMELVIDGGLRLID